MELFHVVQVSNLEQFKKYIKESCIERQLSSILNKKSGDSLLHHAAKHGKTDILEWLHEFNFLPTEQGNFDGKKALHEASQHSHIHCIKYLLSKGANVDALKKADW